MLPNQLTENLAHTLLGFLDMYNLQFYNLGVKFTYEMIFICIKSITFTYEEMFICIKSILQLILVVH